MTVLEVVKEALGRLQGTSDGRFMPRPAMYERVGRRQQRLFSRAAQEDQEYFGTWADGELDINYRLDLNDLLSAIPAAGRITKIEILDAGTAPYLPGRRVYIVTQANLGGSPKPRVTIRDQIVEGVEQWGYQDLEGVVSLRVFYPKMTAQIGAGDGDTEVELPEPWSELLVLDLAMFIVRRDPGLDADLKRIALDELATEHGDLYRSFERHLEQFAPRAGQPPVVW